MMQSLAPAPKARKGPAPGSAEPPSRAATIALDPADLLENDIFGHARDDPRARPFAMLRSQLLRRLGDGLGPMLAVTSTQPENGKSFVAINLAMAMAQIHATCLVDLDLRRPVIAGRLGLPPGPGVDDYLLGDDRLGSVDCTIGRNRLTVLPVNTPRAESADLLAAPRADLLFRHLRALPGSPICIVDTPPVLEDDDMMILARHVDGIILVVQEGRTRQSELRESFRLLDPARIVGTILNRTIRAQSNHGYGHYSGYRPR